MAKQHHANGGQPQGDGERLVECSVARLVLVDGQDRQYLFLSENGGQRGFPIVIGTNEAHEIHRVLHGLDTQRPLTHQLAHDLLRALSTHITHVDVVDLHHNTYFAQITLENEQGDTIAVVDARPSDAIALALRAQCKIRVAEKVVVQAVKECQENGQDPAD